MPLPASPDSRGLLRLQLCAAAGALLLLAFAPAPRGKVLLVPLASTRQGDLVDTIISGGGRRIAAGPVAGSIAAVGLPDGSYWRLLVVSASAAACMAQEA